MDTITPVVREQILVEDTPEVTVTEQVNRTVQVPTTTAEPATAQVGPPRYVLCSPLEDQSLQELLEIVSSPYDPPPEGKDDRHQGVDFAYYNRGGRKSIEGEGVQAILPGRVVAVTDDRLPYGNSVVVETNQDYLPLDLINDMGMGLGESLYSLYAHFMAPTEPRVGDWVMCGDPLGLAGATGYNIPVAHLHLETRIGPAGSEIGTMAFYDTQATAAEMAAYRLWRMSGVLRHFDPMRILNGGFFDAVEQP